MPEVLFEPPAPIRPVAHARSTIVLASRAALTDAGYAAAYEAALDAKVRRTLDEAVAATWLPLDVALAHYRACDGLRLSPGAAQQIGRATNDRVRGTLYGTFIRVFNEAGGTPWNVLPHWQRFWDRGYDGGGLRITKLGPKDARVDVMACGLCASDYFRNALRGLSVGFIEVFCTRAYAQEVARSDDGASFRYQWA